MVSIRGVWLIRPDGEILFSRRFPTVERRVANRIRAGREDPQTGHHPADDTTDGQSVVSHSAHSEPPDPFESPMRTASGGGPPNNNGASTPLQTPVSTPAGSSYKTPNATPSRPSSTTPFLSPSSCFLTLEDEVRKHYLPSDKDLCAHFLLRLQQDNDINSPVIHLVDDKSCPVVFSSKQDVILLTVPAILPPMGEPLKDSHLDSAIIGALTLLEEIAEFTAPFSPRYDRGQLSELNQYIALAMPFGSPIDTNCTNIRTINKIGFSNTAEVDLFKRPCWKPYLYKGKQKLEMRVREEVWVVLYGKDHSLERTHENVIEVQGNITCKADLEGLSEVTVPFTNLSNIRDVTVHMCTENHDLLADLSLCFTPPLGKFPLCKYNVDTHPISTADLPVTASYEMKETPTGDVSIVAQIDINPQYLKASFAPLEAYLPLKNRGYISSHSLRASAGSTMIGKDRKSVIWSLSGQKFSPKSGSVTLKGTVSFDVPDRCVDDPFFVGNNALMKINFKVPHATISGLRIDPKSISMYPASAKSNLPVILVDREICSAEYYVWNVLGDVRSIPRRPASPG